MAINIDDFKTAPSDNSAPNFSYTMYTKSGETIEATGYFVVNSVFAGFCRGDEGIIYDAIPFEDFKRVVNHGPVNSGSFN